MLAEDGPVEGEFCWGMWNMHHVLIDGEEWALVNAKHWTRAPMLKVVWKQYHEAEFPRSLVEDDEGLVDLDQVMVDVMDGHVGKSEAKECVCVQVIDEDEEVYSDV